MVTLRYCSHGLLVTNSNVMFSRIDGFYIKEAFGGAYHVRGSTRINNPQVVIVGCFGLNVFKSLAGIIGDVGENNLRRGLI